MKTKEALRVVNWMIHRGLRFEPFLEAGALGLAVDVEGKEVWPTSSSHIGAGQEQQEQSTEALKLAWS